MESIGNSVYLDKFIGRGDRDILLRECEDKVGWSGNIKTLANLESRKVMRQIANVARDAFNLDISDESPLHRLNAGDAEDIKHKLVLFLNTDYEGGDLKIGDQILDKKICRAIYIKDQYELTPVTSGTRYTVSIPVD